MEALSKLKDLGFTVLEARLMGLSKTRRKDGDWFELKLQVQPDDMPTELYTVDLGTRINVAMVRIADDETVEPRRKFEDLPASQQAGIRCADPAFLSWLLTLSEVHEMELTAQTSPDMAAEIVRKICRVESRAHLDNHAMPREVWQELNASFETETRLPEQRG